MKPQQNHNSIVSSYKVPPSGENSATRTPTKPFPNKHFDLETVLNADLRPVAVLPQKSFVGFFGAEKFEALKGAMSFDEIWNEIDRNIGENDGPRVYIVSWNDHFFVLKVEDKAYYIIDTLGERLFEGCNQAFVLKFDDSALMHEIKEREKIRRENGGPEEESDEMICSGKRVLQRIY
ncbi:unnamed protein product [Ilex paraguariensis]|uniref:Uncharacterized protein n=1 Tax=Ilex paraguariensis TaxID=185542 RepID=A0ABC8SF30_9AQUA